MSDPDQDLKAALAALAREQDGGHLSPDELVAYEARELDPADEERVQEHLAACPDCLALLRDLDLFRSENEEGRPSEIEVAAVWQGVRARSAAAEAAPPAVPLRPPRALERSRNPVWMRALAASLAVAVVGLSAWVASLRRSVDDLARPQLNVPVLDIYAAPARGEASPPTEVKLPTETGAFTLVLNPDGALRQTEYAAEIVRGDGTPVWSGRGLRKNAFDTFSLTLSARLFTPGSYRIRLFGVEGSRREPAGEYVFHVHPPGG